MPPEWMWPFDDELTIWFEEVDRLRKEKYGNPGESQSADMVENEYARGRRD